jgi:hypothetical protein
VVSVRRRAATITAAISAKISDELVSARRPGSCARKSSMPLPSEAVRPAAASSSAIPATRRYVAVTGVR